MSSLTIARALERVADHATDIAEEAFYLARGEDIRHEHSLETHSGSQSHNRRTLAAQP